MRRRTTFARQVQTSALDLEQLAGLPPEAVAAALVPRVRAGDLQAIAVLWATRQNADAGDAFAEAVLEASADLAFDGQPRQVRVGEVVTATLIGLTALWIILGLSAVALSRQWKDLAHLHERAKGGDRDAQAELTQIYRRAAAGDPQAVQARRILDLQGTDPDAAAVGYYADLLTRRAQGDSDAAEEISELEARARAGYRDAQQKKAALDRAAAFLLQLERELQALNVTRIDPPTSPPQQPPPSNVVQVRDSAGRIVTVPFPAAVEGLTTDEVRFWADLAARAAAGDQGAKDQLEQARRANDRGEAPGFYPDFGTDAKQQKAARILGFVDPLLEAIQQVMSGTGPRPTPQPGAGGGAAQGCPPLASASTVTTLVELVVRAAAGDEQAAADLSSFITKAGGVVVTLAELARIAREIADRMKGSSGTGCCCCPGSSAGGASSSSRRSRTHGDVHVGGYRRLTRRAWAS